MNGKKSSPRKSPAKGARSGVADAVSSAGGIRPLARKVGVAPNAPFEWVKRGYVPGTRTQRGASNRVLDVERATGVPRHRLNRSLYPEAREAQTGKA